jgi:hypothetical protein
VLVGVAVRVLVRHRDTAGVGGLVHGELVRRRKSASASRSSSAMWLLLAIRVSAMVCDQAPLPTGCSFARRMPSLMSLWSRWSAHRVAEFPERLAAEAHISGMKRAGHLEHLRGCRRRDPLLTR